MSWSKDFAPSTIAPGGIARLSFTITNFLPDPAVDLQSTDTLPGGVVIATPANASASCGTTLSAPAGGTTIAFSGDSRDGVAGNGTCTLSVDVTAAAVGAYSNVSGDLTSSFGSSGSAQAELTVEVPVGPLFSIAFSPDTIPRGATTTRTDRPPRRTPPRPARVS